MADRFGKFLANVLGGTKSGQAPGHSFNAAMRRNREVLLLDDGGAAAVGTTIVVGVKRGGDVLDAVEISATTASLAGTSFSLGTRTAPTKYSAAVAGPGAGATVRIKVVDDTDLGAVNSQIQTEELVLTTSVGALPTTAGSKMQVDTYFSHK